MCMPVNQFSIIYRCGHTKQQESDGYRSFLHCEIGYNSVKDLVFP